MNPLARGNPMNLKRRKTTKTPLIPRGVSIDVLSRLPAKSLMRFRCVCKSWNSLIRDTKFAELHHTRSLNRPGGTGLIVSFKHKSSNLCFILTDYKGKPTQRPLSTSNHDRFSQVINGLVCLTSNNGVFLCNLFTRQIITLPYSNLKLWNLNHSSVRSSYLFGFDPWSKQYKVLTIWTIEVPGREFSHEFEVYTLGTNSWRRIIPPEYKFSSPFNSHNECICVNGVIYWIQHLQNYKNKYLELFDVKDEKFQRIGFPKGALVGSTNLIQVQGRLAIAHWPGIRPIDGFEMRIWILESYRHPVWKQETIIIPTNLSGIFRPYPVGTIHTGEILVMDNIFSFPSRFLFYDLKTKSYGDSTVYTHFIPLPDSRAVEKKWARFSHNEFKEIRGDDMLKLSITDQVENILPLTG